MSDAVYKLIRVCGSDAGEFLQGQLTQDMRRLDQARTLPAAWCSAKGRVISILRVLRFDDGYGLVLPASLAETVCERLKVYRLRADVALEAANPDWACLVIDAAYDLGELDRLGLLPAQEINACRNAHGLFAVNIGIEERCIELMGFSADFAAAGIDPHASAPAGFLRAAKIRAGIVEILGLHAERFTPHMLNLDLLGAVSFDKGCYVGQEVIARTENLGSSKRRIMRYRSDAPISCGDTLFYTDGDVGEVINVNGNDLLAVVQTELHDKTPQVHGMDVTPMPMPYELPGS
jgi:tRNA-modifying protein YgfZ